MLRRRQSPSGCSCPAALCALRQRCDNVEPSNCDQRDASLRVRLILWDALWLIQRVSTDTARAQNLLTSKCLFHFFISKAHRGKSYTLNLSNMTERVWHSGGGCMEKLFHFVSGSDALSHVTCSLQLKKMFLCLLIKTLNHLVWLSVLCDWLHGQKKEQ